MCVVASVCLCVYMTGACMCVYVCVRILVNVRVWRMFVYGCVWGFVRFLVILFFLDDLYIVFLVVCVCLCVFLGG